MRKYKVGLIISLILLGISIVCTIFEIVKISTLDKMLTSEKVEVKCHANTSEAELHFKCDAKYYFKYDEKEYACIKYVSSMVKKLEKENDIVYFSSKNPNKCYVGTKSLYVHTFAAIDFILLLSVVSNIIIIKRGKELILK